MINPEIEKQSIKYVKENSKKLIKIFADLAKYPSVEEPFSIFMAGSPGAGKTEFSTSFNPAMIDEDNEYPIVRIDPDEIKKYIPQYNMKNTDSVQKAATIIADKLYDFIQDHYQNVIVDSTLANYNKCNSNITRALGRKRTVGIVYIYQDPLIAWKFTKAREIEEGRPIPKDFFISSFYNAKDNVNKIKSIYGNKVKVILVIKDFLNRTAKTHINIDNIDHYIKLEYNKAQLDKMLTQIKI